MADVMIKFKTGNIKIKPKKADFVQETLNRLNEIKIKKEKSNQKIAGAMPSLLFSRKNSIGRQ